MTTTMTAQPLSAYYSGSLESATDAAHAKQVHDAALLEHSVGERYAEHPELSQWYGGDLDAVIAGQ